jgi:tetratricopeptide (TPR) repeat protein
MKKCSLYYSLVVLLCNSALLLAQSEPEELKTQEDHFQDYFFEALLQKGIENNDKAIVALEHCLQLKPNDATVYSELGRNYFASKDYSNAYLSFEHATQLDPKNKWFWVGMYDVSYETKNFDQGIRILNTLISFDDNFKEDLISLYMNTKQFDKALQTINERNEKTGKSERRDAYKMQILSEGKYQNAEITNLLNQINKYPTVESNYISLIYLYSINNQDDKAFEITKKLEIAIPTSEWSQVSLFKKYIDNKEGPKAIAAMNIVLASSKIDVKIKHRILNEFLLFVVSNPQYSSDLDKAISYFDSDVTVNVSKEIGKFYQSKKQWEQAIKYYEQVAKKSSDSDSENSLLLLQAYTEIKQFDKVAQKAESLLELFPSQAELYYYSGLANNQLFHYKKAKEILEMGLDYLVNNKVVEINFYIQLGEAYNGLGDFKKKEIYFQKANALLKEKK